MAPLTSLALAFMATASLAAAQPNPYGHAHGHRHLHKRQYANTTTVVATVDATAGAVVVSQSGATYTSTSTYTETLTSTIIDYITEDGSGNVAAAAATTSSGAAGAGAGAPAASGAAASGASSGQCGGSIYITVTDTVTVTEGASTSSLAALNGNQRDGTFTDTASAAPAPSTTEAAPAPAAPATTSEAAPSAPAATPEPASSSAAAPAPSAASSGNGVQVAALSTKRGCLYNYQLTSGCSILGAGASYISWSANWNSVSGWENATSEEFYYETTDSFVPQLWGLRSVDTEGWAANAAAISSATAIMGYNEPDCAGQSNLDAGVAAASWNLVSQYSGSGRTIISPSVTSTIDSSGTFSGLTWLQNFASAGASWDATGLHFYADCTDSPSNQVGYLQSFVSTVSQSFPKDIWVTEYGCETGASPEQIGAFLTAAGEYLESESAVAHYAAFMASDGILLTSNAPNAAGQAYVATSSS